MNEQNEVYGEMIEASSTALSVLERAQIDMQIATAHKYPRSMENFKHRALAIATLDEETAASCIYRRPVGTEGGRQKYAEGMSVRTAEIVGACYGNLRVASRIVEQTDRQIIAQGVAHDLESNFLSTSEVIESTVDKYGKPYSERMRVVVAKAALAKARRDATFQVVPKALCKPIEKAVREILVGDAKTLETRRKNAETWISRLSIDQKRVWFALDVAGAADLTAEHLELLTGLKTAIVEGDTTVDEAFPPIPVSPVESGDLLKTKQEPETKTAQKDDPVVIEPDTIPAAALSAAINTHKVAAYFAQIVEQFGGKVQAMTEEKKRECLKAMLSAQEAEVAE